MKWKYLVESLRKDLIPEWDASAGLCYLALWSVLFSCDDTPSPKSSDSADGVSICCSRPLSDKWSGDASLSEDDVDFVLSLPTFLQVQNNIITWYINYIWAWIMVYLI